MSLKEKTILVTGGSRGLGLGLVEALVDRGARVTVVARDNDALASVRQRLGVAVQPADVTDEGAAHRILAEVRPDILVLNAGATPRMGRLDRDTVVRDLRPPVTAEIGSNDPVARGDQRRNLVAPHVVQVGKAVQQQHVRTRADDLDIHIDAVDGQHAAGRQPSRGVARGVFDERWSRAPLQA